MHAPPGRAVASPTPRQRNSHRQRYTPQRRRSLIGEDVTGLPHHAMLNGNGYAGGLDPATERDGWAEVQGHTVLAPVEENSSNAPQPLLPMHDSALLHAAAALLPMHCNEQPATETKQLASEWARKRMKRSTSTDVSKLNVILDIDHTLLHACEAPLGQSLAPDGVHQFILPMPKGVTSRYWVRFREGVHAFLHEIAKFATVHVFTMASVTYTKYVLDQMDPAGTLIGGQVVCRADGKTEVFTKSATLVGGLDLNSIVAVDDREEAWDPLSRELVIQLPAFRYFSKDRCELRKSPLADTALMDVLRVLRDVHAGISSHEHGSTREALSARRQSVLSGVHLVFSGGLLSDAKQPQRCVLWRLAATFGASCHVAWTEHVPLTHVISGRPDSASVGRAAKSHIWAVSPDWLLHSAQRWHRQSENLYALQCPAQLPASLRPLRAEDSADALRRIVPLIPCSLTPDERLLAAVQFLVPHARRADLSAFFTEYHSTEDLTKKNNAILKIAKLVGQNRFKVALKLLDIT